MIQPDNNQNKTFDYSYFLKLPPLDRHQYTESLLVEKIKLTYEDAICCFLESLSQHEKLAASFENFRAFKDRKFSELPDNVDCLLFAAIDKFTGIFHIIIKNQYERSFSFYELDSLTQELIHKGNATIQRSITYFSPGEHINCIRNQDLYRLRLHFLVNEDSTVKDIWNSAEFDKTKKDATVAEVALQYPQYTIQPDHKAPYIVQKFTDITTPTLENLLFSNNIDLSDIYNIDLNSGEQNNDQQVVIISNFSVAHSKLDSDYIENRIHASICRKIKNSRSRE